MSSDDNIIHFRPSHKKDKNTEAAEATSESEVISFYPSGYNKREKKKDDTTQESDTPSQVIAFPSAEDQNVNNQKDISENTNMSDSDSGSGSNKEKYIAPFAASALCLMLVGFPFLNRYSSYSGSDRQPASNKIEESKLLKKEKKVLDLIHTGQRKIASIGTRPAVKDIFSLQLLQSRYDIRWKRDKLVYATLLEGQEPIIIPSTDKIVRKYSSLFPVHADIQKVDSGSEEMEIYRLKNRDSASNNAAQVEVLKDINGKLLSIHVVK